jgi:signal transduction histidine kinase
VRRAQGEEAAAELSDPVPELLDRVAELGSSPGEPLVSATEVLEIGTVSREDLVTDVTRVVLLRDQVLELWEELPRGGAAAVRLLNRALDASVLGLVVQSSSTHARMGRALDRLSEAARGPEDIEVQIEGLLHIVLEEAVAVDGAVLLLREPSGLRVCAAVGVEGERARGRVVSPREGFPAEVVLAGGEVLGRWAGDPLLPESGSAARAVFGVPLLADGALVGVAYVVSLTARAFPPDDRRLVRAAADRAAAVLTARRLRTGHGGPGVMPDEVLRARDRALSTFAHDLRSPLGVVLMQAGVMSKAAAKDDQPERMARRAASLQRAAVRMERLLSDYIAFQEVRGGVMALTTSTVQPTDLVRHALDGVRGSAEERRVALEAELSAGLPPLVGDEERLQEALEHLLRAALQVVPDGGRIVLRAQHDEGGVVFSVADSAPPVEPEVLARVFDRAWMGERPAVGRGGLGLAVARGIVEAHGGRIWASSASGEGNTFCFALPAARA